eukprot:Em0008g248a
MIEFWLTNDPTASWENLATALDGISEIKKVQEMMDLGMKEGEDDLVDVVEEVIDAASKWRSIGLVLRVKVAELDTISSKDHTDPTECLKDMLLAWLQLRYDFTRFGLPSWKLLCQAISKPVLGYNPALAMKIAHNHYTISHVP